MAILQNGFTTYNWNGYSSDVKPTSGVPEGSTFHVVDTGAVYFFHNSMWELDKRMIFALKYSD
jgi:hypothetical protein